MQAGSAHDLEDGFARGDVQRHGGAGELDLTAFADRLKGKGWNGVVALEVLSAADREDSVANFARRCCDATLPYWQ